MICISQDWSDLQEEFSSEFFTKIYYRLTSKYEIVQGRRNWDYVPVIYVSKDEPIETEVPFDGQYPVFLIGG